MDEIKKTVEIIGPDHPISKLSNHIAAEAEEMAEAAGLSQWELCLAYANGCGFILASSKDMDRDHALDRMDSLREAMQGAYDLFDVEGTG